MALDTRWKLPQGKTPDALYDCLFQLIRELRKGDYLGADGVSYDNGTSGLTADDVQEAVDELAGNQSLVLLDSGTFSNTPTLDLVLSSYTAYRGVRLVVSSLAPASNDVDLWMRLSSDGGSTFATTSYEYAMLGLSTASDTPIVQRANGQAQFLLAGDAVAGGLNSSDGAHVVIDWFDHLANRNPRIFVSVGWRVSSGQRRGLTGIVERGTAAAYNALRILCESGNIASGKWALYGYL